MNTGGGRGKRGKYPYRMKEKWKLIMGEGGAGDNMREERSMVRKMVGREMKEERGINREISGGKERIYEEDFNDYVYPRESRALFRK